MSEAPVSEKTSGEIAASDGSVRRRRFESRNIFRLSNVCVLLYVCINIFLIWSILSWFNYGLLSFEYSILVYGVSLLIALSPVGEWILRLRTGCKPIKREDQKQMIMPLFEEAYAKAKELTPGIPDGIRLYINDDGAPNAFATGRKTICVTRGLLEMPPEQIKAILAHEFGHIAHRDTYMLQCVIVGNFLVYIVVTAVWLLSFIFTTVAKISAVMSRDDGLNIGRGMEIVFTSIAQVLTIVAYRVFMWLWEKLGVILCMKSSRGNEYEADRFSFNCGYGRDLIAAFESFAKQSESPKGVFAILASSHPGLDSRIAKLQELGREADVPKATLVDSGKES